MTKIRIAKIEHNSQVDGPGKRTVVFVQGCPIHCPGCQNQHLWDPDGGSEMEVADVVTLALEHGLPLTISGGEPFHQADAVSELMLQFRIQAPNQDIIVYSGCTYEGLRSRVTQGNEPVRNVLLLADVLVDGPYKQDLDHNRLQWRGSPNQRVIDLEKTVKLDYTAPGRVVFHDPVLLDWDRPTFVVDDQGDLLATEGLMREFFGEDNLEQTRMCGQTKSARTVGNQ